MATVASVFAIAFSLVILAGWVALLGASLVAATASIASVPLTAMSSLGRRTRRAAEEVAEGLLILDGVADEALADEVRTDIGRVLQLAPAGTHPKACACVRSTGGDDYVGVLRMYNNKGHYLLRATGDTIASVAQRFTAQLRQFREFPAKVGAKRPRCADCDSSRCPLKLLARQARPAAA